MAPFPVAEVKETVRQAIELLNIEKMRWSYNRQSLTFLAAESLLQHFDLLHLALEENSAHIGDIFADVCAILPLTERAFRCPPHDNVAKEQLPKQRSDFRLIISSFRGIAEKVKSKEFTGVAPFLSSDTNFAENLSAASFSSSSDDSDGSEDSWDTMTAGDPGLIHEMESLRLSKRVEWMQCTVLFHELVAPPLPEEYFSKMCRDLFPFDSVLVVPGLLTAFMSPGNVPIIVLSAGPEENEATSLTLQDSCKQLSERFPHSRVIAVPYGAILAPIYERQSWELPEPYFRFVSSTVNRVEYPSVLDIQLRNRTAIGAAEAASFGIKRAVRLQEIHVLMLTDCPTMTLERARLNANYSDIFIDECDGEARSESIELPDTMMMMRQLATASQQMVTSVVSPTSSRPSSPRGLGSTKKTIRMGPNSAGDLQAPQQLVFTA